MRNRQPPDLRGVDAEAPRQVVGLRLACRRLLKSFLVLGLADDAVVLEPLTLLAAQRRTARSHAAPASSAMEGSRRTIRSSAAPARTAGNFLVGGTRPYDDEAMVRSG